MAALSQVSRFLGLAGIALAMGSCAGSGDFAGGEDGFTPDGTSPRRPSQPSFVSPGVILGRLEPILFDDASWEIPPSQMPRVEAAAKYLKIQAERVILAGTAEVSSPEYARQLGQQRALAVKEALIEEGIPSSRISTTSYGGHLPRARGERVEFGLVPTGEALP